MPRRAAPHAHALQQARGFLSGLAAEDSKVYQERRLLGWSPEQLYSVVSRVDEYSRFVPWCVGSKVLRGGAEGGYLEAELEVGFQVFVERYTSKVTLQAPNKVHSSVSDSRLFDHLESTWLLRPGPQPGTTWLVFKVDFAFRSALYRHVADLFFSEVVKRMIGAFEGRCREVYGPSSLAAGGGGRRRAVEGGGGGGGGGAVVGQLQRQHPQPHQPHPALHQSQTQQQQQRQQRIEYKPADGEGSGGAGGGAA
ncbi:hypothetical protein Rsub_10300 [Raphidocelis subcapitata]|uniref:Coenzyme Q-binding protein COQ10 START domain-containing protein n=1 Tax=Raphidocelis subcapitata TaxID=307507 RepID=A0A2V0PGC9_9CHLO|nr:hypothetical protein Rsub_10300 [Raphidocelis subcapitata]|eukprot:GBF98072.1 hypothetical protein Rsub_10300 [Raphidocelis subcapitata]